MGTPRAPFFTRTERSFRIPLAGVLDQAGAITFLASFVPGFRCEVEKAVFIPDVAGAGAGATQALQVRKGSAAGTVLCTATPTLATHVLGGAGISDGVVAPSLEEQSKLSDTDAISITKAAGTVFSAGGGTLQVVFRQKPQGR